MVFRVQLDLAAVHLHFGVGEQTHVVRVEHLQYIAHVGLRALKDVPQGVFEPLAAITPDLVQELLALRHAQRRQTDRPRRIDAQPEHLHTVPQILGLKVRALQNRVEKVELQHRQHVAQVRLLLALDERAARNAQLPAQARMIVMASRG